MEPTQGMGRPQITPDMLRSSKNIVCECGGMIFSEKLFFKKISAFISPSGKEEVAPMPIIVCENCGKVPGAFDTQNILPEELRADGKIKAIKGDLEVEGDIVSTGSVYAETDVFVGTPDQISKQREKSNLPPVEKLKKDRKNN